MAQIIGQVYNVRHIPAEGDRKERVIFNLGHRKAFQREGEMPNLFTQCVCYVPGIVSMINEHFKAESKEDANHGKWIALTGHFNEYTWQPDPVNNEHHRQYEFPVKLTAEMLRSVGIILAQGSAQELVMNVCAPQTTREFVVNGFEFVGNAEPRASRPTNVSTGPAIRVAGVTPDATAGVPTGNPGTPVTVPYTPPSDPNGIPAGVTPF